MLKQVLEPKQDVISIGFSYRNDSANEERSSSLLAMGMVAPLGAFAHSAYHPYLHASFKENIVPTPNAFNGDFYGGIVKGPDGATWFTERVTNKIGRLDSSDHFREYTLPTSSARPEGITVGPDRALW